MANVGGGIEDGRCSGGKWRTWGAEMMTGMLLMPLMCRGRSAVFCVSGVMGMRSSRKTSLFLRLKKMIMVAATMNAMVALMAMGTASSFVT